MGSRAMNTTHPVIFLVSGMSVIFLEQWMSILWLPLAPLCIFLHLRSNWVLCLVINLIDLFIIIWPFLFTVKWRYTSNINLITQIALYLLYFINFIRDSLTTYWRLTDDPVALNVYQCFTSCDVGTSKSVSYQGHWEIYVSRIKEEAPHFHENKRKQSLV